MKIVLVCQGIGGHGGWYTYSRGLCDTLKKNGHAVTVVSEVGTDGDHPILPSPFAVLGKPLQQPAAAKRLRVLLDALQPDIIHFTVEPYALLVAFLPKKFRRRSVMTVHGSYGIRLLGKVKNRFQACRAFKRMPHFIAVSDDTKDAVSMMLKRKCRGKTCRNFSKNVRVIKNGIVLPAWTPKPRDPEKNILLVGTVQPRKGVLEALEGCAVYKRTRGPHFLFTIAGAYDENDAYVRSVQSAIDDLELDENVRLVGPVSDERLEKLYREADLYLMPSPTGENALDAYGIGFLEANAYGVPTIGPDAGGAAEAIAEARTGFRVDPQDPKQIGDRMHQILDEHRINPENCRAWAEKHVLADKVREIEQVYSAMLAP